MSKEWKGTVRIDAPVEQVYAYLSDFSNQAEWDLSTAKIELKKPGDASGVGAEYKVYERLQFLSKIGDGKIGKDQAGLGHREVKDLIPNQRIAWHSHPVPAVGISIDCAFDLVRDGDGTILNETVRLNTTGLVDAVQKVLIRGLDDRQHQQWQANLERIKEHFAGVHAAAAEPVLAAH